MVQTAFALSPVVRVRNLNKMKQDLYILEITLKGTSATTSIKWETLGFEGSDLEEIKASEAKLTNIPLFKVLKDFGQDLSAQRAEIYSQMIRAEGRWACTADKLPQVWADFQVLVEKADELRQQLEGEYEPAIQEFLDRVQHLLGNRKFGLSPEQVEKKLAHLIAKFPSRAALDNFLIVGIGAFEMIPSISSQLQTEAAIANAEAEKLEAQNRASTAAVVQQIQRQQAEDIQRLRAELIKAARDEGYQIVAKLVGDLSKWEPGKKAKRLKTGVKKHLERLEALLGTDLDGSLEGIFHKVSAVADTLQRDSLELKEQGRTALQQEIERLKASLEESQTQLLTDGDGHLTASAFGLLVS